MVIQGLTFVFRGIQNLVPHKFAVVQNLSPALVFVVVVVDYGVHTLRGDVVVVQEFGRLKYVVFQLALQLRILADQLISVLQVGHKEMLALLDIRNARLPEKIQQIDPVYADIAQSVQLALVPGDLIAACPGLNLLPHVIRVCTLKSILL